MANTGVFRSIRNAYIRSFDSMALVNSLNQRMDSSGSDRTRPQMLVALKRASRRVGLTSTIEVSVVTC